MSLKSIVSGIFQKNEKPKQEPKSVESNHVSTQIFTVSFDGEKNPGEIGVIKRLVPDNFALRERSWQSYLESDVTQTSINKFITWIVGQGLKLQSEPISLILDENNIDIDRELFSKKVEAYFKVYSEDKEISRTKQKDLSDLTKQVAINALMGGDCLVVQRYEKNQWNIELIDGSNVRTPFFNQGIAKGNICIEGVEINSKKQHVAYHIYQSDGTFKRVKVNGTKSNFEMAYMVYGLEYRINSVRGIPIISAVLESLKKLDRYKEATVGSAEERQKIPFTVEHNEQSTGENPLIKNAFQQMNPDAMQDRVTDDFDALVNKIVTTYNKQVFNMPIGSSLKSLESKNELYFKDFFTTVVSLICAAIGIPPEVAMSKYDSNYSASRAAIKDWEHTVKVWRNHIYKQFNQKVYKNWLTTEIMKGTIQAPGYLEAYRDSNKPILSAFLNSRFVGSNVPHIDPKNEVEAERMKLGELGKNIPLTTAEAATEAVNGGDFDSNIEQYAKELDKMPESNQTDPN